MLRTLVLLAGMLVTAGPAVEAFDLSGMPPQPTSFDEQRIRTMVTWHHAGDVADAVRIQSKLAAYYRAKGDTKRAEEAERRAREGSQAVPSAPATIVTAPHALPPTHPAPVAQRASGFHGSFFGYQGRTLHTWDFAPDGTFLHTLIVSGSGTSVRNSERGRFTVSGNELELSVASEAGGFVTGSSHAGGAQSGGSASQTSRTHRLSLELRGPGGRDGIVLGGVPLKPKSW